MTSGKVVKVYEVEEPTTLTMQQSGAVYQDCSSLYRVELSATYTSQGNDLGHSPVHGMDTKYEDPDNMSEEDFLKKSIVQDIKKSFGGEYSNLEAIGNKWQNMPFSDNANKQAAAKAVQSKTALTEDPPKVVNGNAAGAFEDNSGATPLGFIEARLHMYYGVCVEVVGIADTAGRGNVAVEPKNSLGGRWVEIMAETMVKDQQICVKDQSHPDSHDDPATEACAQGELYQCRDGDIKLTGSRVQNGVQIMQYPATGNVNDVNNKGRVGESNLFFKFYCRENCDDPDVKFRWRISAHQEKPQSINNIFFQKDGEDWCASRKGDDFPSSLLDPYPVDYDEPAVFGQSASSAGAMTASVVAVAAAMVAALF